MRGLLLAVRPLYLGGGLFLLAIGAAHGAGKIDPAAMARAALVVVLVHIVTHYVNDAEDVETDEISQATSLTGGSRAIQRGLVTPARLLRVSAWLSAGVVAVAAVEIARGDRIAAALDLGMLLFGYAYSGRPFMLGRRGMSELDAALVMGVFVPLAGAHAAGGIGAPAWAVAAVLFVETLFARLCTAFPDLDADRQTGKRTLPAIVGERGSAALFGLAAVLIVAVGLAAAPSLPRPELQRVRALVVAVGPCLGAWLIWRGTARRVRITAPLLGVVTYFATQATLLVAPLLG